MRRIMTDRPNSVHTQFIRRKIVPLALLVALVAGGLSGCILVPVPVYPHAHRGWRHDWR
jgi:hypothetical protein